MSAPLLMVLATLLFAVVGVAVKYASAHYGAGELVFYRSAIGAVMARRWCCARRCRPSRRGTACRA
jgi:drug/metabolite transporter (DMT)-like permease